MKQTLLTVGGAAVGGALGVAAFLWLTRQGFYGLVLPGGLLGLGAGIGRTRSVAVCALCGVAALALGLFAEWQFRPFTADSSLGYFVSHISQLQPLTLVMAAAGAFIGFWVPFRRRAMPR